MFAERLATWRHRDDQGMGRYAHLLHPGNHSTIERTYHRHQKPFAVMVRDLKAAMKYGRPNQREIRLLTSPHRPVVLVPKTDETANEAIAPGLAT